MSLTADALNKHVTSIITSGRQTQPRGLKTLEVLGTDVTVDAGDVAFRHGGNIAIGFMEGFQLIAGEFYPSLIEDVAGSADLKLFTAQSAYGPRISLQVSEMLDRLSTDRDSRQAILMVANRYDAPSELPCTIAVQYLIRDNTLKTIVSMRSSDAIWGLPYDIIQFSMLSQAVAAVLGVEPGHVHFDLGSAHLYADHAGNTQGKTSVFKPWGTFLLPQMRIWRGYREWAERSMREFALCVRGGGKVYEVLPKVGVNVSRAG